jgi:hypothetical protein
MGEFDRSQPDYFAENRFLLDGIHANAYRLAKSGSTVMLVASAEGSLEVADSAGLPSVEDIREEYPHLEADEAAGIAEAERDTEEGVARERVKELDSVHQLYEIKDEAIRLMEAGDYSDEVAERFAAYKPKRASSGTVHKCPYQDYDTGQRMTVWSTTLFDEAQTPYASAAHVEFEDELVTRKFRLHYAAERPLRVEERADPIKDALLDHVIELVSESDKHTIVSLMAGSAGGELAGQPEIDTRLSEIWRHYQGTSQEQEVGPLLDEVRQRYFDVTESDKLERELGEDGRPSFQHLNELNDYLSQTTAG